MPAPLETPAFGPEAGGAIEMGEISET